MSEGLFSEDYRAEPYWWQRTPRPRLDDTPLPARADVAIVGSGYTGLNAAIQTARGDRDTVVLDAEAAGWGCSSRNGGQIGSSIKSGYVELERTYGHDIAFGIAREGHEALAWIGRFIESEAIDCDYRVCGRFYAAHTPRYYEALARQVANPVKGLETDSFVVPPAEQHTEIDSDLYHGGVVHPRHAALDPGRYHQGLLERARAAGTRVVTHCRVTGISRARDGFELRTERGTMRARDVVIATNGYTGAVTRWFRRRVIPIGSYVLATTPLDEALVRRLIPNDRVITDTRRLVVYYRTCPERRRIVFGGRVSINETDPTVAAPALHAQMVRRFPELASAPMSHAWMGFVAYTFDEMPHLGVHDGMYYAMGYCGSGVSLASYFGHKIGLQVLGRAEGDSPLARAPFVSRAYYFGRPWFLAPTIRYYQWRDEQRA